MKEDHHIDLKLHFEVGGLQCWTGEQSGEDHVQGNRKVSTNVPISDLNILNLCGISCIAFCTPTGLHPDQLKLYAPDSSIRVFHHQLSCQGLRDSAVSGVQMSSNEEFGK